MIAQAQLIEELKYLVETLNKPLAGMTKELSSLNGGSNRDLTERLSFYGQYERSTGLWERCLSKRLHLLKFDFVKEIWKSLSTGKFCVLLSNS